MNDRRDVSVSVEPGSTLEVTNESAEAHSMTVDYGAYGTIKFNVPIGGKVEFKIGTEPPRVYYNDVETNIFDGDNVVSLKKPN